jgi:hypothetical protein
MKLRRNQYCPIHRSFSCLADGAGFRYAALRAFWLPFLSEPARGCAICQVAFTNYSDIVPDHIDPRGMGGSRRDDHADNIQAVHFWCNGEKGSTREY